MDYQDITYETADAVAVIGLDPLRPHRARDESEHAAAVEREGAGVERGGLPLVHLWSREVFGVRFGAYPYAFTTRAAPSTSFIALRVSTTSGAWAAIAS